MDDESLRATPEEIRPIILLLIFFLLWAGRGHLQEIAQVVASESARLAQACLDD